MSATINRASWPVGFWASEFTHPWMAFTGQQQASGPAIAGLVIEALGM